ncbi:MAG: serine hydrolase [Planctomycetes bacterium]|nr:serine hydrolase [Planctomycetota bacterium]MCC7172600.1 serine hydrolase [Planctomycetota bacterium]
MKRGVRTPGRNRAWWSALLGLALVGCQLTSPTSNATDLETALKAAASRVRGDVGIYVRHLRTGETFAFRADETFPAASMIKVPILCGVMNAIARGDLRYDAKLEYDPKWSRGGEDLLAHCEPGSVLTLSKLVLLMITTSDNTASVWCQELAGSGTAINAWLDAEGFPVTRVNSRTEGREQAYREYGWGQTTAREMAELLVRIRENKTVDVASSEEMYRCLTRIYWNGEALSEIPPTVTAASKQGALQRSRSEVVLVNAPHGDYVFSVITKNQLDESWDVDNEGFVLLRNVSSILWQHFEPDFGWAPASGANRFVKS